MRERTRAGTVLCAALLAAACGQDEQETPFMPGPAEPVSRTIGESGGTVSTPAGLSLDIPAGALGESVEVTITPRDGIEVGAAIDGEVVAGTVFLLDPAGQRLGAPAAVDLGFEPADFTDEEMLGLAAFNVVDGVPAYRDFGTLDLNAGILRADLLRLGTVGARVAPLVSTRAGTPEDDATGGDLFGTASASSQALRPLAADGSVAYTAACGLGTVSCVGEDSPVQVYVSPNIAERFAGRLGVIGANVEASLTFNAVASNVEGQILLNGVLRARAGLSVTSHEVDQNIVTGTLGSEEPVPTEFEIEGTTITLFQTQDGPLELEYSVIGDTLELVLPETTIELEDADGATEQGTVSVVLSLVRAS